MSFSPYYQRLIQRAAAHDQNQQGFVNSMLLNPIFQDMAGQDALRDIQQMRLAANKLAQDRSVELTGQRQDLSKEQADFWNRIRQEEADLQADDSRSAERLGWAGVGANLLTSGIGAYNKKKEADKMDDLTRRLFRRR